MLEIAFDIESQTAPTSWDAAGLKQVKISVLGLHRSDSDTYHAYEEHELAEVWKLFEQADRIISYNGIHFDIPVMQNYYAGDLSRIPHLDMIVNVKDALGFRLKLDDLAKATLKKEKSADGLQAVRWWAEGKVQEIKDYCIQDVKVTRGLYDFGKKNKQLFYPNLQGEIVPFPVNFDPPAAPATTSAGSAANSNMNLTLPF